MRNDNKNPELQRVLKALYNVNQKMRKIEMKMLTAAYTDPTYLKLKDQQTELELQVEELKRGD